MIEHVQDIACGNVPLTTTGIATCFSRSTQLQHHIFRLQQSRTATRGRASLISWLVYPITLLISRPWPGKRTSGYACGQFHAKPCKWMSEKDENVLSRKGSLKRLEIRQDSAFQIRAMGALAKSTKATASRREENTSKMRKWEKLEKSTKKNSNAGIETALL